LRIGDLDDQNCRVVTLVALAQRWAMHGNGSSSRSNNRTGIVGTRNDPLHFMNH
jgi:hypothetical protein